MRSHGKTTRFQPKTLQFVSDRKISLSGDFKSDRLLAVKDNQPKLAESIMTFFEIGQAEKWKNTPCSFVESVEKDHGRLEVRRCWAFDQLDCLANPQQWPDLKTFGVIESERYDQ